MIEFDDSGWGQCMLPGHTGKGLYKVNCPECEKDYWLKRAEHFFPTVLATEKTLEQKSQEYWKLYQTTRQERYLDSFMYLAQIDLRLDMFCTR